MESLHKHYPTQYVDSLFMLLLLATICIFDGSYSTMVNMLSKQNRFGALMVSGSSAVLQMKRKADYDEPESWVPAYGKITAKTCPSIPQAKATIETVDEYSKFEFKPSWISRKEIWDNVLEERYSQEKKLSSRLPLKVIIVPHSHNDPGWLKTYEDYFNAQTRNILNNLADKVPSLNNMTFIWSEISFLSLWWESAHLTKKRVFQQLVDEKRVEIVTGGWVMTDEATSHLYAMVDQLIEGHQWVKNNLGIKVKTGWSVDPFGHGPTVPYLLKLSGVDSGTIIQRIHYTWKYYFAKTKQGDFLWRQNWDSIGHTDMLVHNQPFTLYDTKQACGPFPKVCLNYDFRKIRGESTEYSILAVPINQKNIREKADALVGQYQRTGSLSMHKIILVPLGGDFRYDHEIEWHQQYDNYRQLINYINGHKDIYNMDVAFGTPLDYFEELRKRTTEFSTLTGDLFPYSDIETDGTPHYWNGYFTTRPYWKLLNRELERNLRSAEILYTYSLNKARQQGENDIFKVLERNYEKLIRARRHLGLFQHHDAITGTSKAHVMRDYALKLIEGIKDSIFLQQLTVQNLLFDNTGSVKYQVPSHRVIVPELDFESYDAISPKVQVKVSKSLKKIVLFNSLAQHRTEVLKLEVDTPYVKVIDATGKPVLHQINPVWNISLTKQTNKFDILSNRFELLFVANLKPLALHVFTIAHAPIQEVTNATIAVVYCQHCQQAHPVFQFKNFPQGDMQLENLKIRALFDNKTGFLRGIIKKKTNKHTVCELYVGAYRSKQFQSGAYLFQPDIPEINQEMLLGSDNQLLNIISGPVASMLSSISGEVLTHSAKLYHLEGPLGEGIYFENIINFGIPSKNRDTELFMRFSSGINNGKPPVFYTDTNGLQMQKRKTVEKTRIEGNYYPITEAIYIEDDQQRLSLLVGHSQGASAWQPGWLEVMVERRTLYDDSRGMGEGVLDQRKMLNKYWLLLEDRNPLSTQLSRPSLLSNYLSKCLQHPPDVFILEDSRPQGSELFSPLDYVIPSRPLLVQLINKALPCDVHLFNLRTLTDQNLTQFPSTSALLILHRLGFACDVSTDITIPNCFLDYVTDEKHYAFRANTQFSDLKIKELTKTSLTGLYRESILDRLDEMIVYPMELVTANVTFGLAVGENKKQ
ncbi:hypothetical protein V9T40_000549 [Parthenolecanium corni]|uniref:Alpha-mannosidase n=1 Tax=Parthenolecanium corni TaxID=536013 RepID=A0AAN9TBU6_9HEMI